MPTCRPISWPMVISLAILPSVLVADEPEFAFPDYTKITGFLPDAQLPQTEPAVLWKHTSDVGLSNPVVVEEVVYFGDDAGGLFAVRSSDGVLLWKHAHGKRISSKPSVDRDHLYFGSDSGITALRRDSGVLVWQHMIPGGAGETTPLPAGPSVFGSSYDGNAYCLDRRTGTVVWSHDFVKDAPEDQPNFDGNRARFQEIAARPRGAACDGRIFVQAIFDQSRVIALDMASGKRLWSFQTRGWIGGAPTIAQGRVYIPSQDKFLYCVDGRTGEQLWKFEAPTWLASQVAVHDGLVYLPVHGARLYQLNAADGAVIRPMEPAVAADRKGSVYSFPIVTNDTACFAHGPGVLYAVDIANGQLRWKLRPSEKSELFTDPVTDGRRIFVTSRPGQDGGEAAVLAIGVRP